MISKKYKNLTIFIVILLFVAAQSHTHDHGHHSNHNEGHHHHETFQTSKNNEAINEARPEIPRDTIDVQIKLPKNQNGLKDDNHNKCNDEHHHHDGHDYHDEHHNDEHHNDEHHNDEHHNDEHHNDEHHNDEHHNDENHNDEHHHDEHHHDEHHHDEHHHDEHEHEHEHEHGHGHEHAHENEHNHHENEHDAQLKTDNKEKTKAAENNNEKIKSKTENIQKYQSKYESKNRDQRNVRDRNIPPKYQNSRYANNNQHPRNSRNPLNSHDHGRYQNAQTHSHSHGHGHGHSHGSVFSKHLETNNFLKTFKQKFDEFIPNLYMKAIIGILFLSLPSYPVFLALSFISRCLGKNNGEKISEEWIQMMIAFSAGTLLGDLLLHMFPHLMEEKDSNHVLYNWLGSEAIYVYIILGVVTFLIVDFVISISIEESDDHTHNHNHTNEKEKKEEEQTHENENIIANPTKEQAQNEIKRRGTAKNKKEKKKHTQKKENKEDNKHSSEKMKAFLYLLGDLTHNLIDGMAVGASFVISTDLGLVTSMAIFVHEIPHEIGDFAYLFKKHYSLGQILKTQVLTSLGAFAGGILGINWGTIYKVELLAFTSGAFLYLCMVNLFPELKNDLIKSRSFSRLFFNVLLIWLGVALMYYMTSLE